MRYVVEDRTGVGVVDRTAVWLSMFLYWFKVGGSLIIKPRENCLLNW
jgi:hypothetical protein